MHLILEQERTDAFFNLLYLPGGGCIDVINSSRNADLRDCTVSIAVSKGGLISYPMMLHVKFVVSWPIKFKMASAGEQFSWIFHVEI